VKSKKRSINVKSKLLALLIGVSLILALVAVPLMSGCAPKVPEAPEVPEVPGAFGDPIKFAMCDPMTGPHAVTGMGRHMAVQLLTEAINDKGGLVVDGVHHLIDHRMYDNVSWNPFDEKKAYEKMILKDGVGFSISTWTSATTKAVAELCQENKHLRIAWGGGWLNPDYPYIMSEESGGPLYYIGGIQAVTDAHPELKRVAWLLSDNTPNLSAKPWIEIGCRALGLEVVYDKIHPDDTVDYMPVMSAVVATNPDLIIMGCATAWQAAAVEAAMVLGYKGAWLCESLYPRIYDKEVWDYFGSLDTYSLYGNYVVKNEFVPDIVYEVYTSYEAAYPGQWDACMSEVVQAALFWKYAVETAGSTDPTVVMNTLYAMPEVDHPVFGKSGWGGEDIHGCSHWLITPVGVNKIIDGVETIVAMPSILDFLNKYSDLVHEVLDREGLLYQP